MGSSHKGFNATAPQQMMHVDFPEWRIIMGGKKTCLGEFECPSLEEET